MKKKILIVSLAVNIIAGAFVFYAFTSKEKSENDGGGGYLIMHIDSGNLGDLSISDGNNIIDHEEMHAVLSKENIRLNNQITAKKMNSLMTQGYQLVSSNGGDRVTNFVFQKK